MDLRALCVWVNKSNQEELYAMVNQGAYGFMLQAGFELDKEDDNEI